MNNLTSRRRVPRPLAVLAAMVAAVVAAVGLVVVSAVPASASVTAPSTASDGDPISVSGSAATGATYAAIAVCNTGYTLGTACNTATGTYAIVPVVSGSYSGGIVVEHQFTNGAFGGQTPAPGSTGCAGTGGTDTCVVTVSYYTGTFPAISHITGADETSPLTFV